MRRAGRLEDLAELHGPRVLAYIVRRVDPRDDAADVYTDVLAVCWRRINTVPTDDAQAFAWMIGVARNCLSNHRRGSIRRSALADKLRHSLPGATTEPDPTLTAEATELLGLLNNDDRELVTLVYWDDLSITQAATVLGLTPVATRKRLERVRSFLRQQLMQTNPC
jgi:RNA polymerase sigma-70 factor (ECF subfamily)